GRHRTLRTRSCLRSAGCSRAILCRPAATRLQASRTASPALPPHPQNTPASYFPLTPPKRPGKGKCSLGRQLPPATRCCRDFSFFLPSLPFCLSSFCDFSCRCAFGSGPPQRPQGPRRNPAVDQQRLPCPIAARLGPPKHPP